MNLHNNEQHIKMAWVKPTLELLNPHETYGGHINNNPENEDATGIYS